jgi:thymidylate synthase
MKEYNYISLLRDIVNIGKCIKIHNNEVKELIDIKLIINEDNIFYCDNLRPLNKILTYLFGELIWYLSGDKRVGYISKYSSFWNNLVNDKNEINSNYGYLVFYKKYKQRLFSLKINKHYTGFEWCVSQFVKDMYTRQAVILYNDKDYYYDNNKDFICTQTQQFLIRDNELISIVYIRSSDIIFGLTYDIVWWNFVQQQICNTLNIRYKMNVYSGKLIINIGSCHLYLNKFNLIEQMLKNKIKKYSIKFSAGIIPLNQTIKWYEKNLKYYINYSKEVEEILDYIARDKKLL